MGHYTYQANNNNLIPKHGGYRKLKSFKLAQLIYDVTVRFCALYISKRSRTHDQMVQAARSGVQNIAEGSMASGTSKKTELKLTNVARASLEELRLDYEDFLRQRGLPLWEPNYPSLQRFKAKRCSSLDDLRAWLKEEKDTDEQGHTRTNTKTVSVSVSPCKSVFSIPESGMIANAALSLLNLCCYFLDQQLKTQADSFIKEGGFTERLYTMRAQAKRR